MSVCNPGGAVFRQSAQWPALSSEVLLFLLQLSSLAFFSPLFLSSSAFLFFFCSFFSLSWASSLSRCAAYWSLVITLACRGTVLHQVSGQMWVWYKYLGQGLWNEANFNEVLAEDGPQGVENADVQWLEHVSGVWGEQHNFI